MHVRSDLGPTLPSFSPSLPSNQPLKSGMTACRLREAALKGRRVRKKPEFSKVGADMHSSNPAAWLLPTRSMKGARAHRPSSWRLSRAETCCCTRILPFLKNQRAQWSAVEGACSMSGGRGAPAPRNLGRLDSLLEWCNSPYRHSQGFSFFRFKFRCTPIVMLATDRTPPCGRSSAVDS